MPMTEIFVKISDNAIQQTSSTAMSEGEAAANLQDLDGWSLRERCIEKTFRFTNFQETMRFVQAIAEIAEAHDHHPEMVVGYDYCKLEYITHDVNGLTERDFISAATVDTYARDLKGS